MWLMRGLCVVVYLGGAILWAGLAELGDALRCDDACTGAQYARSWQDNVDAWQWDALPWFAFAGLALAAIVVALVWRLPKVAAAVFAAHLALLAANVVVISVNGQGASDQLILWSLPFVVAGLLLVATSQRPQVTAGDGIELIDRLT